MPHDSSDTILNTLSDVIDYALTKGATSADIKQAVSRTFTYATRLGEPENIERAESESLTVRLFKGQKKQSISATRLNLSALKADIDRALSTLDHLPEDPYAGLATGEQITRAVPVMDTADSHDPDEKILMDMMMQAEKKALAHPSITNSKGGSISWDRSRLTMVSSNGFRGAYQTTEGGYYVQPVAGSGDGMQVSYDSTSAVYFSDLKDPDALGHEAAEKTVAKLNPRKVKTGVYPVLYDRDVSASLIGQLISALSGSNIARGVSFLKDKKDERLFDYPVHIHDNPTLPRGLGSRPFDGEGFALRPMNFIHEGRLENWLMDLVSARKLGALDDPHLRGTGSTTNVILGAGPDSPETLMRSMGRGLLITSLMSRPDSLANGDYSVGASGFWIEKGVIAYPVHEVTVSGNLLTMFKGMVPANDLIIDRKTNAPSLYITEMTVGGE